MSHFLVCCGFDKFGDCLLHFSAIVSCLGHDAGHTGYTNRFLIETRSPLALTYNDKSPLENMHASTLFSVLWAQSEPDTDITKNLSREECKMFRRYCIQMILATDNGNHEKVIKKMRNNDERLFRAAIHAADLGGAGKVRSHIYTFKN